MAYFVDLSEYSYLEKFADRKCLNVGWLSGDVKFSKGNIAPELIDKLKLLSKNLEHITRGHHYCEFCEPPIFSPRGENFVCTLVKDAPNGNGEIWLDSEDGTRYIAPALLVHYIEEHNYLPPKEFLDALSKLSKFE